MRYLCAPYLPTKVPRPARRYSSQTSDRWLHMGDLELVRSLIPALRSVPVEHRDGAHPQWGRLSWDLFLHRAADVELSPVPGIDEPLARRHLEVVVTARNTHSWHEHFLEHKVGAVSFLLSRWFTAPSWTTVEIPAHNAHQVGICAPTVIDLTAWDQVTRPGESAGAGRRAASVTAAVQLVTRRSPKGRT